MRAAPRFFGSRGRVAGMLIVAGLVTASPTPAAEREDYSLRWSESDNPANAIVEVRGVGDQTLRALQQPDWSSGAWSTLLPVYADAGRGEVLADGSVPPMLGRYSIELEDQVIRFRPQFPLQQGVSYRAIFRPAQLPGGPDAKAPEISTLMRLRPPPKHAATVVSAVYPSGTVLPENLLKFYLHFSAPMRRGHIYDHIHLLDELGKPVELPFLELDEELWNPEMTRLTLFIDPGRIKRGVLPLEDIGPSLETGKSYVLEIDAAWLDSSGLPLGDRFRKSFRVGPPDREPPDPAGWTLTPPNAGTTDPLSVRFSGPMDHALALRMIRVVDAAGGAVEGSGALTNHEERWTFTPTAAWRSGAHQLTVQRTIEDLAGNNIGKPFEVDLFEKVEPRFKDAVVKLSFEVR